MSEDWFQTNGPTTLQRQGLVISRAGAQMAHGVPRVDDWRVLSGIAYVIRNGLQWKMHPSAMARTRRSTTVSSGGKGLEFSTAFSPALRVKGQEAKFQRFLLLVAQFPVRSLAYNFL